MAQAIIIKESSSTPECAMALVVDTNVLLSTQDVVDELIRDAPEYELIVVIPWAVVMELDSLKDRGNKTARAVTVWLHELMAYDQPAGLRIQKPVQITQHGLSGDDAILDCCLYLMHREGLMVALFSNDRNLDTRAIVHDVPTLTYTPGLTSKTICEALQQRMEGEMVEDTPESEVTELPPANAADGLTNSSSMVSDLPTAGLADSKYNLNRTDMNRAPNCPNPARNVPLEAMPHRETTDLGQLCRDVRHVLIPNACTLADVRVHDAFSDLELENLQYAGQPRNERDLLKMIKIYKISALSEYLRGIDTERLIQTQLPARPSRDQLETFVAAWAAINVRLAGRDLPQFAQAANDASAAVSRYYM